MKLSPAPLTVLSGRLARPSLAAARIEGCVSRADLAIAREWLEKMTKLPEEREDAMHALRVLADLETRVLAPHRNSAAMNGYRYAWEATRDETDSPVFTFAPVGTEPLWRVVKGRSKSGTYRWQAQRRNDAQSAWTTLLKESATQPRSWETADAAREYVERAVRGEAR